MTTIAKTSRFIIRNFFPEEEVMYLDLLADPEVALYLPKRSREENAQIFKTILTDYAENKALGRWGMFNLPDNDFIGLRLLRSFDEEGTAEVGYSPHKKYWGKGIATEMVNALIDYGFNHTETTEIIAVTAFENIASQRVLEKTGLVRNGNIFRQDEELASFKIAKNNYKLLP